MKFYEDKRLVHTKLLLNHKYNYPINNKDKSFMHNVF